MALPTDDATGSEIHENPATLNRRQFLVGVLETGLVAVLAACETQSVYGDLAADGAAVIDPASGNTQELGDSSQTANASTPTNTLPPDQAPANEIHEMRTDPDSGCNDQSWGHLGVICRFNLTERKSKSAVWQHVSFFEDWTGIRVCPVFSDPATAFEKLGVELDAGSPPDFWAGGNAWIPALASQVHLLDINEHVDRFSEWTDYYATARQDVEFEGRTFGIPFRADHQGTRFVRPSMLERAGIPVQPPSTWDELNDFAKRLTVRDGESYVQSGINPPARGRGVPGLAASGWRPPANR